jgi:hypothetical protein
MSDENGALQLSAMSCRHPSPERDGIAGGGFLCRSGEYRGRPASDPSDDLGPALAAEAATNRIDHPSLSP